jgi:hypothetical protein
MARHTSAASCVAFIFALAMLAWSSARADAKIVPQRSIKGIKLGMSVREVRDALGAPDKIAFAKHPILGRVRVYAYGLTRASFDGSDRDAHVSAVSTTSRHERTSRGIGIGSVRAQVASEVPGVRCRVESGFDHCYLGSFNPGTRVTDFRIAANGRVSGVVVGFVVD